MAKAAGRWDTAQREAAARFTAMEQARAVLLECPECGQERLGDARVLDDMKCGRCAYGCQEGDEQA